MVVVVIRLTGQRVVITWLLCIVLFQA